MKNQTTTTTRKIIETAVTNENIEQLAKKVAYTTIRLVVTKNSEKQFLRMLNNFANDEDVKDVVSVATLSLLESKKENNKDFFINALKACNKYLYSMRTNAGKSTTKNGKTMYSVQKLYINEFKDNEINNIVDVTADINKAIFKNEIENTLILKLLKNLTKTEKQILSYIAKGYTNTTIIKMLGYKNPQTLYNHIHSIRMKSKEIKEK